MWQVGAPLAPLGSEHSAVRVARPIGESGVVTPARGLLEDSNLTPRNALNVPMLSPDNMR